MDTATMTTYFSFGISAALLFYCTGHFTGAGAKYMEKFMR